MPLYCGNIFFVKCQMQETALMKAAKNGRVDVIQLLINHGCDEEIVDNVCGIILCFI